MKKAFFLVIFVFHTASAFAQSYVPFTVTEQDARQLRAILDEQPMKYGLPSLQWMDWMEQRAMADKKKVDEAEAKKKADEAAADKAKVDQP